MLFKVIRPFKKSIEKYFKIKLIKKMPRGLSFTEDMKKLLDVHIVFDIGANTGQSAIPYNESFGKPLIYCFEPCKSTFDNLTKIYPETTIFRPSIQLPDQKQGSLLYFSARRKFNNESNSRRK